MGKLYVEVQNESPEGGPQWYVDYSELKAIIISGPRKTSIFPFNFLE